MEGRKLIFLIACILMCTVLQVSAAKKTYIVYLGHHEHGDGATTADYERVANTQYKILESYVGSEEKARDSILYSYTKNINGFAARLDEEEAKELAAHPDVVSVFPNRIYQLHTTRSWSFADMYNSNPDPKELTPSTHNIGRNVIIATLDSGVWPESRSFSDEGMGPVPSKWRGFCQNNTREGVPCNRKLIGARYFNLGIKDMYPDGNYTNSARDEEGHGSHTLSTAAGWFVPGANSFGYANGTARGGSPGAHVAAYKVCWEPGCSSADILAGFDAALQDGVDIISVSLGGRGSGYFDGNGFLQDAVALGSLHAAARGITVVCSAGNDGPDESTVSNVAPWVITVAASTIDRDFPSYVKLGNQKIIKGASQASEALPQNKLFPMIYGSDAALVNGTEAKICNTGSLDPKKAKGKIVVCMRDMEVARVAKGMTVKAAGGAGMVLCNDYWWGDIVVADPHVLPAVMITYNNSFGLFSYMNSTKKPMGTIAPRTTRIGAEQAPAMAAFSSRGPSIISPQVLKPDVTAPGVNILAAFSEAVSPTMLAEDKRRTPYAFMSGTSMACPHVSGVAGLLRSKYPHWSTAAIRSAIMTTARTKDNKHMPIRDLGTDDVANAFAYGNGHIKPARASDPGLVYDIPMKDYLKFLCALGVNSTVLSGFTNKRFKCPSKPMKIEDLNYPSISVGALNKRIVVTRTLKNVGTPGTYTVHVDAPPRVNVTVGPRVLTFSKIGEEKTYSVAMSSRIRGINDAGYKFGRLTWTDGRHHVRSAIVVNAVA